MADLNDLLTAIDTEDGDYANWPAIGFDLENVKILSAEPDVGIMGAYVDDYEFDGWVGDHHYNDQRSFVGAICAALGANDFAKVEKLVADAMQEEAEGFLDD